MFFMGLLMAVPETDPLEEMGEFTVKVLCDRIHDHHKTIIRTYFPFEIVERDSTKTK